MRLQAGGQIDAFRRRCLLQPAVHQAAGNIGGPVRTVRVDGRTDNLAAIRPGRPETEDKFLIGPAGTEIVVQGDRQFPARDQGTGRLERAASRSVDKDRAGPGHMPVLLYHLDIVRCKWILFPYGVA